MLRASPLDLECFIYKYPDLDFHGWSQEGQMVLWKFLLNKVVICQPLTCPDNVHTTRPNNCYKDIPISFHAAPPSLSQNLPVVSVSHSICSLLTLSY